MSDRLSRGSRAKLEEISGFVAVLPSWMRRLGYYGLALLFVAAAVVVRWELRDVLSPTPFLVFYLAWVGAAAFGGLGPGLLATMASWLCVELLFDFTPGQVGFTDPASIGRLVVLMMGGLTVSLVAERMRRGRIRERRQMHELADLTQLTNLGPFLVRDEQDHILLWSDGCARLYGFTAEQAIGRVSHELLRVEFSQPLETIRAMLHKTGRWEGELTHRRADGTVVHVASLWVLRNGTANPVVLEVNNDITGRKHAEEALRNANDRLQQQAEELQAQADELTTANGELRDSEQALRESEERYHKFFTDDLAGDFIATPDGRIVECNPAFADIYGLSSTAEAVRYNLRSFNSRDWTDLVARLKEECVIRTHQCIHRRPDGQEIHVVANVVGHFDKAAELTAIQGYVYDDTERKRAEEALRESEERLRQRAEEVETLMDLIPAAIWVAHDPQCNHITGNQAANRFYEAYRQENVSANVSPARRFFRDGQELKPEELPMQEAAAQNIDIRNSELDVLLPSGTWRNLLGSASALHDAEGRVRGCIGAFMDITARKQVEKALRESEQRLSLAQQIAHIGTFDWDIRTGVNIWTPELEAMYGLPPSGFAKTQPAWELLVHPDDRAEASHLVDRAFETGEPTEGEWRVVWPDGSVHWLSGRWQVFKDESGEPLRMTGVNIDITARKQAEEALRESEERARQRAAELATVLEAVPTPVFIAHDPDCLHITGNRAANDLLRNPPGAEASLTAPAETRPRHFRAVKDGRELRDDELPAQRAARGLQVQDFEFSLVFEDGTTRSVVGYGTPLRDDKGRPRGAVHVLVDITDRKRAEEALRERMKELACLYAVSRDRQEDLSIDELCRRAVEHLVPALQFPEITVPVIELNGKRFTSENYAEGLSHCLHAAITVEGEVLGHLRVYYAQERPFVIPEEQNLVNGVAEALSMWLMRKRAEEALRRNEEQFHRLFEDDLTGDYISTPEGRILLCNPAFAEMFGFSSAQEAVGTSILDLYTDPGEREPLVERLKREGKIGRFGVWRKRRDGEPIHIVENLVGHFNDRGELYEIKGYLSEDTERKRAEEALRELTATLESKVAQRTAELKHRARQLQKLTLDMSETEDRERKRMAEILHDDLQQQLAAAKFHLGLMRSQARYDASLQATAAQIDHMLMEAIQKSRSLSHELSPAVMHHADFAETLRWLASQVQAKHGLVVHVHAHGEIRPQSDAINGFLYKAVQELLFNIVKHARVDEAEIRVRQYPRCICLKVSDRGRGFDPQELRDASGFGLLNIRERIELLGGRMRIKSAKGTGSTFSIVVPAGEQVTAPPSLEAKAARPEAAGPHAEDRLRVLLADDHEIVRQGLLSLLSEEHTIEVVGEAANGREAVDLADRLHPDVVIMDVSMPLIDGDAATRQIKTLRPQTRVIALSMYDEPEKMRMMRTAGAESYVLKTASSEELLAAIRGQTAAV